MQAILFAVKPHQSCVVSISETTKAENIMNTLGINYFQKDLDCFLSFVRLF